MCFPFVSNPEPCRVQETKSDSLFVEPRLHIFERRPLFPQLSAEILVEKHPATAKEQLSLLLTESEDAVLVLEVVKKNQKHSGFGLIGPCIVGWVGSDSMGTRKNKRTCEEFFPQYFLKKNQS